MRLILKIILTNFDKKMTDFEKTKHRFMISFLFTKFWKIRWKVQILENWRENDQFSKIGQKWPIWETSPKMTNFGENGPILGKMDQFWENGPILGKMDQFWGNWTNFGINGPILGKLDQFWGNWTNFGENGPIFGKMDQFWGKWTNFERKKLEKIAKNDHFPKKNKCGKYSATICQNLGKWINWIIP